jgi:hypothetical protein
MHGFIRQVRVTGNNLFCTRHFLVLFLVLGLLALLALDHFFHKFNIAMLSRPARNSINFLSESPF